MLTRLTDHDAFAVGITTALQFGPQLFLSPLTGLVGRPRAEAHAADDHAGGRWACSGSALGLLVLTGTDTLLEVYGFALLLGVTAAFDAPARQSFVSDLVGPADVSNAVALNSASFNLARLLGPAVAGLLTEAVGPGWVFLINSASFAAVLVSLRLHPRARVRRGGRPEGVAAGRRRRVLHRRAPARPAGGVRDGRRDGHVRAELPDLRLDDGRAVRAGRDRVRPALLRARGGRGDRRAAVRPPAGTRASCC